MDIVCVF